MQRGARENISPKDRKQRCSFPSDPFYFLIIWLISHPLCPLGFSKMWQWQQAIPDFLCCPKPKRKLTSSCAHSSWKRNSTMRVTVRLMHQWVARCHISNSDRLPTLKSLRLSQRNCLDFPGQRLSSTCHLAGCQTLTLLSWCLGDLWPKPHTRNHLRCLDEQWSDL